MSNTKPWSNLAQVVYRRTYSRPIPSANDNAMENWSDTVERVIEGNVRNRNVPEREIQRLRYFMMERKAIPAGRGLWYSGSVGHGRLGGVALCNCWGLVADDWMNFVLAQDLLMLGGGVGMSVEHRYVSKLPRVRKGVVVVSRPTKDADFIIPDSREGWCELTRRVLEAFFVTGKSFSYSTVCVRPFGEPIKGFGGVASGPGPLVTFVEKLVAILLSREGRAIRPIDAADIVCAIGELVVSGNVRRSAILILGDCWDKEYLKAKRWDLGDIPTQRAMANFSVVCDDVEDLHPLFWKTYEQGEPFGIINRRNMQAYGRMGERKKDSAVVVNPCVPAGTEVLTDKGYFAIESLVGQTINAWNGFEFSPVQPQITGYDQPLLKVTLSSGQVLVCTPEHNFWVRDSDYRSDPFFEKAKDLVPGRKLQKTDYPVIRGGSPASEEEAYWSGYNQDNLMVPHGWNLNGRLNWLAGVIDSERTSKLAGGVLVFSPSRDFLVEVQKMLTTMGAASSVASTVSTLLISAASIQRLRALGLMCERVDFAEVLSDETLGSVTVESIEPVGTADVVYCFKEGRLGLGCFNGIVTGQCAEATLEDGEPCVAGDTLLLTKTSVGQIKDLVGQSVDVWNGEEWSTVVPTKTGENQKLYRVQLSDGSYLDCTSYHKWLVKDRFQDTWQRVRTCDLMGYSKYPLQVKRTVVGGGAGTELPEGRAYTLGVVTGDGCVDGDTVIVDLFGRAKIDTLRIEGVYGNERLRKQGETPHVRVRCHDLDPDQARRFRYEGADGLAEVFSWAPSNIRQFLAGWLDTDGSETSAGGVRLYISGEAKARRAQLLAAKAGVLASVNLMQDKGAETNMGVRSDDMWYLQITDARMLPCLRLDVSRGHTPRSKGRFQCVVRVEELPGLHDVYCFEEPKLHQGLFGNVLTGNCNLQEIALPNLNSIEEFEEGARLMHRWGKRVTMETYHHEKVQKVIDRNRRIGTGITGCLEAPELFTPSVLDHVYAAIQDENVSYSRELGIAESIRTTVIKPSGTVSKLLDVRGEGLHPGYSRYMIQRVRFATTDPLIPRLREAGHHIEPVVRFDGSFDHSTQVVDFYIETPPQLPCADEGWDTWKQLDTLLLAQKHWADQAVSVTVYYRREELAQLRSWLADNLKSIKTISFLCHGDHGFKQAPKEAITKEEYERLSSKIAPIDAGVGEGDVLGDLECAGGVCPIR